MMRTFSRISAALLLLLFGTVVFAQTPTGAIEGTITDPAGAAVPGATVRITSPSLGTTYTLTTTGAGFYSQRNLQPGNYDITVEASGFNTYSIKAAKVDAGAVYNGSGTLQIGSTSAVVEVSGEVTSVDTVRQTVDSVIGQTEIKNLPLVSRNFLDLASLTPGTIVRDGGNIDPTKSNAYRTVGIDGRSGTSTRVQVDGIDITDETVGTTTANLPTDAVQEFQLQRSSLDLSTSLTSSGAVSIISKSGTNQLHGTSFFDYTNNDLQARIDYLASSPDTERKRYGAGAGGALIKNKLFVYGNLEKSDQLQGQTAISATFPQYNSTASLPLTYQYAFGKLDYNISNSVRAFYSFLHSDDLSTGGTVISPYQNVDWTNVHTLGLTMGTARTTHDIRFGYMNFNNHIDSSQLKIPFPTFGGVPYQLNIADVSVGPNSLAPQQTYQDNFQWSYDGSLLVRNHTFRFGVDVRRIVLGGFANFAGPLTISAQYDEDTIASLKAAGLDTSNPLNYPLQEFSTGPNAGYFTIRPAHNLPHGGHYDTRTGAFIGDSWKVTRNFTLNLGVRWQYDTAYFADPNSPRDPLFNRWLPGSGVHSEFPWDAFSPSVGFAWDVTGQGKTVIRGGFYRAYEMNINNNTFYDEYASIPAGIGPDQYLSSGVTGPDGTPINIANHPNGDYSDLVGPTDRESAAHRRSGGSSAQSRLRQFQLQPERWLRNRRFPQHQRNTVWRTVYRESV